jgi:hypothetical protein
METSRFRVWMYSRPGLCREFYDGYVMVVAEDKDRAIERAKDRGHRDWIVERIEILRD